MELGNKFNKLVDHLGQKIDQEIQLLHTKQKETEEESNRLKIDGEKELNNLKSQNAELICTAKKGEVKYLATYESQNELFKQNQIIAENNHKLAAQNEELLTKICALEQTLLKQDDVIKSVSPFVVSDQVLQFVKEIEHLKSLLLSCTNEKFQLESSLKEKCSNLHNIKFLNAKHSKELETLREKCANLSHNLNEKTSHQTQLRNEIKKLKSELEIERRINKKLKAAGRSKGEK